MKNLSEIKNMNVNIKTIAMVTCIYSQVQVRVPTYKQVPVNDWSATTEQQLLQNTTKSRVGRYPIICKI